MRQNGVVGTLAAQGSVGEFGGKARIPMVKMMGTNRAGQHGGLRKSRFALPR